MRTKLNAYLDQATWSPVFGVSVFTRGKWRVVGSGGKLWTTPDKAKAEAERARLRKIPAVEV